LNRDEGDGQMSRRGMARYTVTIEVNPHTGRGAEKGINAIHEAAYQILKIAEWDTPEQGTNVAVNMIEAARHNIIAPHAEFLRICALPKEQK
jgi:hypothetical protein